MTSYDCVSAVTVVHSVSIQTPQPTREDTDTAHIYGPLANAGGVVGFLF